MGNVVPDRFFWALPPPDEGAEADNPEELPADDGPAKHLVSRRVH